MLNLTALRGREAAAPLAVRLRRMPWGAAFAIGGAAGWSVSMWGATTTEVRRHAMWTADAAPPTMSPSSSSLHLRRVEDWNGSVGTGEGDANEREPKKIGPGAATTPRNAGVKPAGMDAGGGGGRPQ